MTRSKLAAAIVCALVASGALPASAQDWKDKWDKVVAAAQQEGEVSCTCVPLPTTRQLIEREWAKDYPGIRLSYSPATLPDIEPQITQERRAGQFIRDVYIWGSSPEMYVWGDQGFLEDIRPLILLPENTNEANWFGGFKSRFQDIKGESVFGLSAPLQSITVRRDLVPESELSLPVDLLNPQFKGKWVVWDPRYGGAGANVLGWWNFLFGIDGDRGIRALLAHDPIVVPGPGRNTTTQMFRNKVPINFGNTSDSDLEPFRKAGFPIEVQPLGRDPDRAYLGAGLYSILMFKNAAHPNASAVFLNWIMSRRIATAVIDRTDVSARTDLPSRNDSTRWAPLPGVTYGFAGQTEESIKKYRVPAMQVARELLK